MCECVVFGEGREGRKVIVKEGVRRGWERREISGGERYGEGRRLSECSISGQAEEKGEGDQE